MIVKPSDSVSPPIYHLDHIYVPLYVNQTYRGKQHLPNFINRKFAIENLNEETFRHHIEASFELFYTILRYEHHQFAEWSASSYEHIDGHGIIYGFSNERDMMLAKLLS